MRLNKPTSSVPQKRVSPCVRPVPLQLLYKEGGIGRFYKGYTPCLIRAFPANAAMLVTVEKVNNFLNKSS